MKIGAAAEVVRARASEPPPTPAVQEPAPKALTSVAVVLATESKYRPPKELVSETLPVRALSQS